MPTGSAFPAWKSFCFHVHVSPPQTLTKLMRRGESAAVVQRKLKATSWKPFPQNAGGGPAPTTGRAAARLQVLRDSAQALRLQRRSQARWLPDGSLCIHGFAVALLLAVSSTRVCLHTHACTRVCSADALPECCLVCCLYFDPQRALPTSSPCSPPHAQAGGSGPWSRLFPGMCLASSV